MIPRKLRLANFLSYRDEVELDLQGVHVACLCGDNGHGKSALLDAMTWCLWGWARGHRYGQGGTSPDELVHQGRGEMEVSLDFWVDGTSYRVVRKYSPGARSRSPALILDLQIATEEGYRSLAEGSAQETEGAIRRLLGMDYETFVNSAFLLQGQADRFTTSTPARRKETLAEILGLSLYERLEERAKEGAREYGRQVLNARNDLQRLAEELDRRPGHEERLAAAQEGLGQLEPGLEEVTRRLAAAQEQVRELERQKGEERRLAEALERLRSEAERLDGHAGEGRRRIEAYGAVLARREEIQEGLQVWEEARRRLESLDAAQSRHAELSQEKLRLEHRIAQERAALEGELAHLRGREEAELLPQAGILPQVEEALKATLGVLEGLQGREAGLAQGRQELQQTARRVEALEADNRRLLQEMEELRGKLNLLGTDAAACPLCGTPLGPDGRAHLEGEFTAQGGRHKTQYRENESALQQLISRRTALEGELRQREGELGRERSQAQERQGALGRELEECRAAARELAALQEQVQALASRLEAGEFAAEPREELAALEPALAALDYDVTLHQGTRARLREMEPFADLSRQLQEAQERLPQEEASLADLESLLGARRQEAAETQERMAVVAQAVEGLPALESQAQALQEEQRELDARRISLQQEAHLHAVRLQELEETQEKRGALEGHMARLEGQQGTYGLLAEAFGKRGVQALLIEAALPELESVANELLGRLTEGRMSLTLETQTQRRRGDVAETLEVRIADELGTRSYELFSGGEAFRISFALRIALARLLASRSGAPLRSLFLDEGFGTQDAEGRERLVEAINSIQDDFDLILVITHIEELKEAFPVRIEVTKTEEQGSTFELVWA